MTDGVHRLTIIHNPDNRPVGAVPHGTLERKPKHGQPCTHCGACCQVVLCDLAQTVYDRRGGPCPALQMTSEGKSECGMVANPERYVPGRVLLHGRRVISDAARWLIGSDVGCDARFNGEPPDHKFYEQLKRWDRVNREPVRAAKKLWGLR